MIKKIFTTIIIVLLVSCSGQDKKNIKQEEHLKKSIVFNEEIYIGKVFFSGDELINFKWLKSGNFKNLDSISYSIYQKVGSKKMILSIEKLIENEDLEKFEIIDTFSLENVSLLNISIKDRVLESSIIIELFFRNKKVKEWSFAKTMNNRNKVSSGWLGNYHINLNDKNEDWKVIKSISLSIKEDSVIYEASGYQLYQKYLLTALEKDSLINLSFNKILAGSKSAVLDKTKNFGTFSFKEKDFFWSCPYIELSFNEGKSNSFLLKKIE